MPDRVSGDRQLRVITWHVVACVPMSDASVIRPGERNDGDMERGTSQPMQGNADLDCFGSVNQVGDETTMIDIGRSEQLVGDRIGALKVCHIPDLVDGTLDERGLAWCHWHRGTSDGCIGSEPSPMLRSTDGDAHLGDAPATVTDAVVPVMTVPHHCR
jgi:hypothetical protein